MKQSAHHIRITLAIITTMALALPGMASAGARQRCLNQCIQTGQTEHKKCQADHDAEFLRCSQLGTNEERNACKRQANTTLKACNEAVRERVKTCKAACPMKD